MSIANRFNSSAIKFNFEMPENHQFAKPSDLVNTHGIEKVYTVRSMYINKSGKFGDEPVIIVDECLVNAPQHLLNSVQEMLQHDDVIDAVNDGKLGFTFREYKNKYGDQYTVTWVDLK